MIEKRVLAELNLDQLYTILTDDFVLGLKLVKERKPAAIVFFISREATHQCG